MTMPERVVRLLAVAGVFAIVAASPSTAEGKKEARSRTFHVSFEPDSAGLLPADAVAASGTWRSVPDPDAAPSDSAEPRSWHLVQLESDNPEGAHAIRFAKPSLRNGEVSVRFRIREGDLDPSVGILFLLDEKGRNGYLVRVSGAQEELVAHYWIYGKRRDLKFARVAPPAPGEWHTLAVRREGLTIRVLYDGVERMSLRDERYHEGLVGLWTESDTSAEFADLAVTVR